ncbi:uncharacterized protein [Primulina eburnea]|uniref:uncharacterized protein isoform X1 n=1 Tax=Primulina eburnea TaxID=1245227 RepID=UPI003C6CAFAB
MATTIPGHSLCLFPAYRAKYLDGVLPSCNFPTSKPASKFRCIKNDESSESHEAFSVLRTDIPCDVGSVWSSIGFYMFSIHVPLSFGGLSVASKILHQPVLDSQIQAFLILIIQILELTIVLLLLRCPGKPQYELLDFFNIKKTSPQRSWLLASVLGFGFLFSLVFITSIIAEELMVPKDVNNPFVKQILSSGSSSVIVCSLIYCIVTPFLEEIVYRGFLLTSLSSKMKWQQAVIISSIIFSAAHFSVENFLQLFIVGLVLGSSYCWTGNLSSSLAIHSMYNALTLFATFMS